MKGIIFALLISYILSIEYLPKNSKIIFKEECNYFYLNTNEFDEGSTLYIQVNAINGDLSSTLNYEFTNISPNSYSNSITPPFSLTPSIKSSSSTSYNNVVHIRTNKYYYSLINDNNYQYLIIKYDEFSGEYLEIENTKINWGIFMFIIIGAFLGLIILICIGVYIFINCRNNLNKTNEDTEASLNPNKGQQIEAPNNSTDNQNNNNNIIAQDNNINY